MQKSAEERAYILIDLYFEMAGVAWNEGRLVPKELAEKFLAWLYAPDNGAAKRRALDRYIEQCNEEEELDSDCLAGEFWPMHRVAEPVEN